MIFRGTWAFLQHLKMPAIFGDNWQDKPPLKCFFMPLGFPLSSKNGGNSMDV
jgi:hypothetical protein